MRSTHPFSLSVGLTVGAATLACPALAEPSPPSIRADVDALLARAKLALDTNDTKEQIASLRGLHAVAPEPRVTCALGMVERRLGQWPEAAEHLTKCVTNPPPGMDDEWLANMRGEKAMARAEVGILRITAEPGAEAVIDGEEQGPAAGRELYLDPKREHRVDVRRGPVTLRYAITLGRGSSRDLVVTFPPPPPLGDWLVFGGAIATAALALGGGALYAASVHGYAEAEHHRVEARKSLYACFLASQSADHCSRFAASWNSAGTLRDAAVIGWLAAGGVGAATAIYHLAKPEERAPRLMVRVGPSSIRLEGTW